MGVKGQTVNEKTGEVSEYHIPDRELTTALEQAGYESWDQVYTHLTSSADFSDRFAPCCQQQKKLKQSSNNKCSLSRWTAFYIIRKVKLLTVCYTSHNT